jgi:hypothetical protein
VAGSEAEALCVCDLAHTSAHRHAHVLLHYSQHTSGMPTAFSTAALYSLAAPPCGRNSRHVRWSHDGHERTSDTRVLGTAWGPASTPPPSTLPEAHPSGVVSAGKIEDLRWGQYRCVARGCDRLRLRLPSGRHFSHFHLGEGVIGQPLGCGVCRLLAIIRVQTRQKSGRCWPRQEAPHPRRP